MTINTERIRRCILLLRTAWGGLQQHEAGAIPYEIYRAACVKMFELVLDQSGRQLRKKLRPYFASNRQADQLTFNDLFRYAAKHCLISSESCVRWHLYRAVRNDTAHEYGEHFAARTLESLPRFVADAEELVEAIEEGRDG